MNGNLGPLWLLKADEWRSVRLGHPGNNVILQHCAIILYWLSWLKANCRNFVSSCSKLRRDIAETGWRLFVSQRTVVDWFLWAESRGLPCSQSDGHGLGHPQGVQRDLAETSVLNTSDFARYTSREKFLGELLDVLSRVFRHCYDDHWMDEWCTGFFHWKGWCPLTRSTHIGKSDNCSDSRTWDRTEHRLSRFFNPLIMPANPRFTDLSAFQELRILAQQFRALEKLSAKPESGLGSFCTLMIFLSSKSRNRG